ncbi:carbohydrate ABC transporter permease [Agromyces badenianii]|uniref:carbohydrate ABC transporter permease n=1 Tax=Agromyces badenianii TaxID=2080742 RepID=UPI000D596085|nr:sugar ABC transporter permease [Agromyces badenianii]PWC03539.1 sugar ABC transporter permease [Agromyces badenianii]
MTPVVTSGRDAATSRIPAARHRGRWLYLAPLLLVLAVWVYGPALFTLVLSFLEWNLTTPPSGFVGLDNYADLMRRPEFSRAVWQTVLTAVALLPFSTVIPLVLAVMLWQRPGRASSAYRSLLFLPVIMAPVAVAVAWRFLLNPLQGLVNEGLALLGIPAINWLGDPSTALLVIVVVTSAKVIAFNMLLYSAALAAIDRRTVEAARLEGATSYEVARFVIVPQLVRTTVVLALLSIVLAGQWTFTNVAELTQGGPDGLTDNVYYRIYTLGFQFFEIGPASAAAVLVLLAFAVVAVVWRMLRGPDAAR